MELSINEIIEFAIQIEKNGEKFYKDACTNINDDKLIDLFNKLADDEIKHKEIFQHMLSEIIDYTPEQNYPEEYFQYLKRFMDNKIFEDDMIDVILNNINTVDDALSFAIQRELDSILFYKEIKDFVIDSKNDIIDRIISEERKHFIYLSELKSEVNK